VRLKSQPEMKANNILPDLTDWGDLFQGITELILQ